MALDARRAAFKQARLSYLMLAVMMTAFFTSAGRINVHKAWTFFGATFVYLSLSTAALYRYRPELLVQRLRRGREGSKTWDEVLMRACNLTAMLAVPVVVVLDVGRFRWSKLGAFLAAAGFFVFAFSSVLINWAMIENPYFEPTVRIQEDREHRVITTGPYRIVRHPSYLSGILWIASIPLMIGSFYAFIPVILYGTLMILRTHLEDRTINYELAG